MGCDISMHLQASSNGQGAATHNTGAGPEVFVKSSSDVKVSDIFTYTYVRVALSYW